MSVRKFMEKRRNNYIEVWFALPHNGYDPQQPYLHTYGG